MKKMKIRHVDTNAGDTVNWIKCEKCGNKWRACYFSRNSGHHAQASQCPPQGKAIVKGMVRGVDYDTKWDHKYKLPQNREQE